MPPACPTVQPLYVPRCYLLWSTHTQSVLLLEMLQGAFLRRWRKLREQANHGYCSEEEEGVPEDVPGGHTVVYVGERRRRFVVRVALLEHPLFRALLDQAREEFGFGDGGKLRIPCEEALFLGVLCHVSSRRRRGVWLCL
ncbi:hypothetical protein BHM03_00024940 [Ensete ventricosum]|nr:hypothetical protein BHM03_00024940 [Ensete ventricosum]